MMWSVAAVLAAGPVAAALAAGVVVIALGLLVLRARRGGRIETAEDAALAAGATLAGFVAAGAIVGDDGAAALVVGGDARVAVVRRHGKRLVAREIGWNTVRITPAGVLIETRDRRFGSVVLAGIDVLDIRRLAPPAISG